MRQNGGMNVSPRLQSAHLFPNLLVRWVLTLLGLLLALPALAQTLAEGDAAFDRRDFATAARIYLTEPPGANPARAWSRLGYLSRSGLGVSKDDHEALKWLSRAAAQDNAYSQNALGLMYRNGEGVAVNPAEAHKWFTKAAQAGYGSAYNNLGVMYRDGVYVARDPAEAIRLFRLGAGKGNIYSQNNLGTMYRDGVGVPLPVCVPLPVPVCAASDVITLFTAADTLDTVSAPGELMATP